VSSDSDNLKIFIDQVSKIFEFCIHLANYITDILVEKNWLEIGETITAEKNGVPSRKSIFYYISIVCKAPLITSNAKIILRGLLRAVLEILREHSEGLRNRKKRIREEKQKWNKVL